MKAVQPRKGSLLLYLVYFVICIGLMPDVNNFSLIAELFYQMESITTHVSGSSLHLQYAEPKTCV